MEPTKKKKGRPAKQQQKLSDVSHTHLLHPFISPCSLKRSTQFNQTL